MSRGGRREKNSLNPDPDFMKRVLSHARQCQNLPRIDLSDAEAVRERVNLYFDLCMEHGVRPGVEGLCTALHTTRQTLSHWANGVKRSGSEQQQVVKDARQLLADLMEQYMLNGEINPVAGIFLASNQFDYDRNATVTVQTANAIGTGEDPARLAEKYRADVIDVEAEAPKVQIEAPEK